MRKIIQIAVDSDSSFTEHNISWSAIVALCDDGSVWSLLDVGQKEEPKWRRVQDIPQDEE